MLIDSYIDPSEMKPQPVAISIGTSEYKGTNYPIPLVLMVIFRASLEHQKERSFKSMIEASYLGGNANLLPKF
jgi:hypothetical protein